MTFRHITSRVSVSDNQITVCIDDARTDTCETFGDLNDAQREQLSVDAWGVGLRALTTAYKRAQEARLEDIATTLVNDVDEQLQSHSEIQEKALKDALARYFDPRDGEFGTRLDQFLGNGGVLTGLLEKHLSPKNSMLASTLSQHIGQESALFKKLSSTDSEGLVHLLGERMEKVLQQEHSQFQKALDPLQKDGAVGRFIESLREEMKKASNDQDAQLKIALTALDTTREDSLLNQMRRETAQARQQVLQAINPEAEGSPLAVIKTSLTSLLAEHTKTVQQQLQAEQQANADHRQKMQESIARIETKKREDRRNARGGVLFEDAVAEFIQNQLSSGGYIVDTTGNVVGLRPSCKVGDVTISFPREHAFSEARVVVEAKRDKTYTVSKALDELEIARKNRNAQVGVFVMAASHAQAGFPTFARHGRDVLVLWDDEDPRSEPHFEAAIMLGVALAQRTKCATDAGDADALRNIEQRLEAEVKRLATIRDAAAAIKKKAELIEEQVRIGDGKMRKILDDAKSTLTALNVELSDEAVEKASPIEIGRPAVLNDNSQSQQAAVSGISK